MSDKQIITMDIDGETYASPNPKYIEKLNYKKYDFKLKESGIPSDYYDLTFRHAGRGKNKDVVDICKNYIMELENGKKYNLYLYGLNGSAKTTTMCCIGKDAILKNYKVKFILAGDLIDLLMKTQGFNYVEELEEKKKEYFNVDVLLIDDAFDSNKSLMWDSKSKNLILSEWDRFLRSLISNDIKLIFTSNIPINQIHQNYGKSIHELINRNFKNLEFLENITEIRKQRLELQEK